MSYTTPPSTPAAPARPGTVSLATTLLYLLGLLSLVSVGLAVYTASFYDADTVAQIYRDAGAPSDVAEAAGASAQIGAYAFGAGLQLLIGVVYLILAVFVGKGKQWARITTWVWAGLFGICCGIGALAGTAFSGALTGLGGGAGGIDQAKVTEEMEQLLPSWLTPVSMVLGIISLLAAIAVVVLLALPPSHPFFRKPEPQWTPPTYPAP